MKKIYAIHFNKEVNNRDNDTLFLVSVGRPVSFKTICSTFIFQHLELTIEKTGAKIPVSGICGIQEIPDSNIATYELTIDGVLKENR
jgi:hypothetical protein